MKVWLLFACQEYECSYLHGVYANTAAVNAAAEKLEALWREDEYDLIVGVDAQGKLVSQRQKTDKFCRIEDAEVISQA